MRSEDDIQSRILGDEAWLAQRLVDPLPDVEAIKLRVRLERGEAWLRAQREPLLPTGLSDRLKHRVRAGLNRARPQVDVARILVLSRWNRRAQWGLAAAAAIAFLFVIQWPTASPPGVDPRSRPASGASELLIASFHAGPTQVDLDLLALDRELRALEAGVAHLAAPAADDALLRGVMEDVDRLIDEMADDLDT